MRGADLNHLRIVALTLVGTARTPFAEVTVIRHIYGVGHVAGDIEKLIRRLFTHSGFTLLQTYRIRVHGVMENFGRSALLNHSARIHYDDVIRHYGNDTEIERNQKYRAVDSLIQIA